MPDPTSAEAFEARYTADPDPWDFAGSPYEQGRYRAILGALDRPRYRSGYEPACSIGVLTQLLAARCDRLRAVDVSPTAVAAAWERCAGLDHVTVEVGSVTGAPGGPHDLVVFSEVGYYFTEPDLDAVLDRVVGALEPGGVLVGCHWTGHSAHHVLHGSTVHEHLDRHPGLRADGAWDHDGFLLGRWRR